MAIFFRRGFFLGSRNWSAMASREDALRSWILLTPVGPLQGAQNGGGKGDSGSPACVLVEPAALLMCSWLVLQINTLGMQALTFSFSRSNAVIADKSKSCNKM